MVKHEVGAEPIGGRGSDLVVAEESLAWSHGRGALRALGFTRWDEFDRREVEGIDLYRQSFATT